MRWLVYGLLLFPLVALAVPDVRVQNRLVPETGVMVGATLTMEVDLLVDTWFTAAPVLAPLSLPGSVVTPPGGEAQHLNEQLDGKAFYGLRYTYQITPQAAQQFDIPALQFQVRPGQGDGPVTVSSQPLSFVAKALAGVKAGDTHPLVASKVTFSQQALHSHDPLRVGDSITRTVTVEAEGAQAMLIPPLAFAEVDGLKRYVQTPKVTPLSDGRGGTLGGRREDSVTYVVAKAGTYNLPAMTLDWWDASTGEAHSTSVDKLTFDAAEGTYTAPFSITQDLRDLGQKAHVRLAGHWLLALTVVMLAAGLIYFGRPWAQAARDGFRRWSAERRSAWLASPEFARRQAREQLSARPPQLGALYLWVRRSTGLRTLAQICAQSPDSNAKRSLDLLRIRYGTAVSTEDEAAPLVQALEALQPQLAPVKVSTARHGLKSLNP
ncbi:BatD family protein [Pseudomonas alkylphenolica]|uniref:BatD family protein n=1 Tax=Pseudomonas alkylphenolica TaxID=237609 RepID=UPI0018D6367B|nr:BatD family protein [Pseudomonas alkylphenolica]MBH3429950.1 BatD family protein [Pseudomonas alkylphenolica]